MKVPEILTKNDRIASMFEGVPAFNQCLSTWADETPPNVSVNGIFEGSGCQSKDAVATVGP